MLFIPSVVYATTYTQPDASSNITYVYGFQSVIVPDDQMYLIGHNVMYTLPATSPATMGEAYLTRVVDTATGVTIGADWSRGAFNYFSGNTIASCDWFTAIYLTPLQITALGYNPLTDFGGAGASSTWSFRIDGDPSLTWGGSGVPPSYIASSGMEVFHPSNSVSATAAIMPIILRLIATNWDNHYPGASPLLQINAGVIVFSVDGQSMFSATIPDLYTICPSLFAQRVTVASFPNAPFVKDYYLEGQDNTKTAEGTNWVAQTWTPTIGYSVNGFAFMSYAVGLPGTVTGALYATAGGIPTGAPLASGTLSGSSLATYSLGEYKDVTFTTAHWAAAGTVYAFVISAPSGDVSNYVKVLYNDAGTYTGGTILTSTNSGGAWTAATGDMMWNAISNSIVNDAFQQKQGGGGNMWAPVGGLIGISGVWMGVILWIIALIYLAYKATRYTNDYRAALPVFIIGMPIGYLMKFVPIYLTVTFEFLIVVAAVMFFARSQPE